MEIVHQETALREDRQLLVLTHLSQLLDYVTGFGGFIVPLILWITNKERVIGMDEHGKSILNFQISLFVYAILCIPAVFLLGLGIIGLIAICILAFVLPIVNAVKASNGETPNYYISIPFFK
jgi:uncharacterized Tic20 family protein